MMTEGTTEDIARSAEETTEDTTESSTNAITADQTTFSGTRGTTDITGDTTIGTSEVSTKETSEGMNTLAIHKIKSKPSHTQKLTDPLHTQNMLIML